MAKSKYEYVKAFEVEDEIMFPNLIIVRLYAHDFPRFSEAHGFQKLIDKNALNLVNSNAEKALNLMNSCATAVLEKFSDIVFAYGFGDEYSFVFKKDTEFHKRRSSKILSLIVSFFTSVYVKKWKEFFPQELSLAPSFHSRIISCASMEVLQAYLTWRQGDCHTENQYNTCLWTLIERGGIKREEAQNRLKVEHIGKYNDNGIPVKRTRKEVILLHSKNIAAKHFWNEHSILRKELGSFEQDVNKIKPEYLKSFQFENRLMPSTWIVVRIDGCNFHGFSEEHEFEKPNDEPALKLMNSCAVAVLKEFPDIVFAYGVSDEYSFVLKKDCQLHQRHASEIVSVIVSLFSSMYTMKWKEFFPKKQLKDTPHFDGRAVCYPSSEILRDYIAWRQVDCHINNQYNTCFWMLVKSGKTKSEAQEYLKGTQAQVKNKLLLEEFDIDYNTLPIMFRQGSSVFWDKEEQTMIRDDVEPVENSLMRIVVEHCNVIESSFWKTHPSILDK